MTDSPASIGDRQTVSLPDAPHFDAAGYFFYFDPVGGRFSKTVVDTGKPSIWSKSETVREVALREAFADCRRQLLGLLYAGRMCGCADDRVVFRLAPIEKKFSRLSFTSRIADLIAAAFEPSVWLRFADAETGHSPKWFVDTDRASLGIGFAPSDQGTVLHFAELIEEPELPRLPNSGEPRLEVMLALVELIRFCWSIFGSRRLPPVLPDIKAAAALVRGIREHTQGTHGPPNECVHQVEHHREGLAGVQGVLGLPNPTARLMTLAEDVSDLTGPKTKSDITAQPFPSTENQTSDSILGVTNDRQSPQPAPPEPKPHLNDPSAAFAHLIVDLAARDDSRRKNQAALLQPILDAYLRTTPAPDFAAKSKIAATINDALAQFELTLICDGKPCHLKVERSNDKDAAGIWVLQPKGAKAEPLDKQAEAGKLPALEVTPSPAIGPWHAKEDARRQGNAHATDPFSPFVPSVAASKEELAVQMLEPLKERLRAMPHETYQERQKLCKWFNQYVVGTLGLQAKCPDTGFPSSLVANKARKGKSYIAFIHSEDKRQVRSGYTEQFEDFLQHLVLVPIPPEKGAWRRRFSTSESPNGTSPG